jgi:hypothetical protein
MDWDRPLLFERKLTATRMETMKQMKLPMRLLVLLFSPALLSEMVQAHHSPVMFDQTRELNFTGTVREFQWTNPHSYIQLLVTDESGTEVEWSLEMGANVYLYNKGWRPSTVKAGDRISVKVTPLRSGAPGGLLLQATTADGAALGAHP